MRARPGGVPRERVRNRGCVGLATAADSQDVYAAGVLSAACLALALALAGAPAGAAMPAETGRAGSTYPGSSWATASPRSLGFRPAVLRDLGADARRTGSTCFLVVRKGKVAAEWNWRGVGPDQPREVFSVTKSVTSTLVGMAQADGVLDVDDRAAAYVPRWRGTKASRVHLEHLLNNTSGRHWDVQSDYGEFLSAADKSAFALRLRQDHRPGRVWAYNNAAIQTLEPVLETATGRPVHEYAADRLFAPLGMAQSRMTTDPSGNTQTFSGLQSTCRDLARLGLLFLERGRWADGRIVPRAWVKHATGGSSQEHNAAYGLLWWVNRRGPLLSALQTNAPGVAPPRVVGRLAPDAPASTYAALGFAGQTVLVDPRSGTVVVRLGRLEQGQGPARSYGFRDAARVITEGLR